MLKKDKKRGKQAVSDDEPQPPYEPTETDSAVPPQDSCIDDVTLKSLAIQRGYLSEIAGSLPKPPVHKTTNRRVFVRKLRPVSEPTERPVSKPVKVLRLLPQGAVVTGGDTGPCPERRAGPRYTEAGQLIPHSILGTEEEFCCEAEAVERNVSIQLPLETKDPKLPVRKTWFEQLPRQENALAHWKQRMRDRRRQQEHIATRVERPAAHLIMNQSDSYMDRQTLRTLIDRAAPYLECGRGYRAGSEFWNQQERLGDYLTGIRLSLTITERGQPPQVQLVGRPDVTKFETGTEFSDALQPPNYPWKQSRYLSTRLQHFEPILNEMNPLDPDLSALYVIGRGSQGRRGEAIQLGSGGSSAESSDEETGEGDRNVSPNRPMEPCLLVQGSHRLCMSAREPVQLRLLMEGNTGQLVQARVSLSNEGTSVVYADWKRLPKLNKLNRVLEGNTQRFYFDLREKVLLPGRSISVPVIFKSAQAGVYWESWQLATRPALQPLIVTFRGVASTRDRFLQARQEVERELGASEARVSADIILDEILLSIATPPRTPPCYKLDRTHEEKFTRLNPDLEFREDLFRALQTLYINSFKPPALSERADSADTRRDGKSSAKKEDSKGKSVGKPAAKKGEKSDKKEELSPSKITLMPSQQEFPTLSRERISEAMSELPEWDLRLESLESAIYNTSGNEQQTDLLLAQFSEVLTRFKSASRSVTQNSYYQLMYLSLAQVLELIPSHSAKLRTFYNLPDKLFIDESLAELGESVVSPTDMNKKKRGQSKQDLSKKPPPAKKGPIKEETPSKPKGSTPSRKGKASVTPKSQQDTAGADLTPEAPKTAEIDPAAERLYSLELRQSVCDLVYAAVGNFLLSVD